MLYLCFAAGLGVSELTSLTLGSLAQPDPSTVGVIGKRRRQRTLPLWKETRAVVRQWLDIRPAVNNSFLFLNARGRPMTRDGFAQCLDLHVATAARTSIDKRDEETRRRKAGCSLPAGVSARWKGCPAPTSTGW